MTPVVLIADANGVLIRVYVPVQAAQPAFFFSSAFLGSVASLWLALVGVPSAQFYVRDSC